MTSKTQTTLAITLMGIAAGLGTTMWILRPQHAAAWALSIFLLPTAWSIILLARRACAGTRTRGHGRDEIPGAITLAGGIIAFSLATSIAKELSIIDGEFSKRFVGIALGVMLIGIGNYFPKKHTQRAATCSNLARSQSLQRFVGWVFVLAGCLYVLVWMVVDLAQMTLAITLTFPVACVLIAIARIVYIWHTRPPGHSGSSK